MNERIANLADLALKECDTAVERGIAQYSKRFAELIVRECINIVKNADMIDLEGPDPEDVLYVACKQLKEHFGLDTDTD